MKILKSNTNQVFDTDDATFIETFKGKKPIDLSKSLHLNHDETDYDFLNKYFPADHPIFNDFGKSFYFVL